MSLVRRIGLAAGPLLALAFYLALPARYGDAGGAVVEFSPSGRATVGMMAWMAAWWMTTRLLFPTRIREIEGGRRFAEQEYRKLGTLNAGERATLIVFCAAVFLWVFRPLLAEIRVAGVSPFRHLSDTSVAVGAALALFLFPVDRAKGLFAVDSNGVAAFLTSRAGGLGGWPPVLVVAGLVTATVFLSEITSNTAQVATMLPDLSALAPALGVPSPRGSGSGRSWA